jgi:hypothetical protein
MAKLSKSEERKRRVLDEGVEHLPEIFEALLDEAKGVHFVVAPHIPERNKPRSGKKVCLATEVESVCPRCKQAKLTDPPVIWEVWKEKRDTTTLRYLHDQIAGRAKAREAEQVDTEIIVVFGDIDSTGETGVVNEVNECKGSLPRTPVKKTKLEDLLDDPKEKTDLGL